MSDSEQMALVMGPLEKIPGSMIFLHYVAPAHFVGGFLITIGLLTRWAVAAQIPILIGAILINFLGEMNVANLITATITLMVCCFFFVYGSGKHSADYYLKMQQ